MGSNEENISASTRVHDAHPCGLNGFERGKYLGLNAFAQCTRVRNGGAKANVAAGEM
jgi:hypothetical protein